MNPKRRQMILGGLVGVLILANLVVHLNQNSGDASSFFASMEDLDDSYTPAIEKRMDDITAMPRLTFRNRKEAVDQQEDRRNPFVFGVDRAVEEEQKRRLAELAKAREEMDARREEMAQSAMQAEAESAEAAPPPATFAGRILGLMENTESGEYLLSVELDKEVFVLRVGDTLADRYQLVSITPENARMKQLSDDREIDLELQTF